jgi:hypothetical protein
MHRRYLLPDHQDLNAPLNKEELLILTHRGIISKGDFCTDTTHGTSHTVGELIQHIHPNKRRLLLSKLQRPAYLEIRADTAPLSQQPWEDPNQTDEEDAEGDLLDPEALDPDDLNPDEQDPNIRYTDGGEEILYHAHPSWFCYTKGILLALLLIVAGAIATPQGLHFAAIGFLSASSVLIAIGLHRASKDYIITPERVEILWGIIARSSKEVRIRDIRAIDVREQLITGLLGLGTLDFSSAGQSGVEVYLEFIRNAHRVKQLVRHLQS